MTFWTSLDVSISEIKILRSADLNCWRKTFIFQRYYRELGNFQRSKLFSEKGPKKPPIYHFINFEGNNCFDSLLKWLVLADWLSNQWSERPCLYNETFLSPLSPPPPPPTSLSSLSSQHIPRLSRWNIFISHCWDSLISVAKYLLGCILSESEAFCVVWSEQYCLH